MIVNPDFINHNRCKSHNRVKSVRSADPSNRPLIGLRNETGSAQNRDRLPLSYAQKVGVRQLTVARP